MSRSTCCGKRQTRHSKHSILRTRSSGQTCDKLPNRCVPPSLAALSIFQGRVSKTWALRRRASRSRCVPRAARPASYSAHTCTPVRPSQDPRTISVPTTRRHRVMRQRSILPTRRFRSPQNEYPRKFHEPQSHAQLHKQAFTTLHPD